MAASRVTVPPRSSKSQRAVGLWGPRRVSAISLDPTTGRLTVDRGQASLDTRARGGSYTVPWPAATAGTPWSYA
ncbi:hypothetical protein GCM10022233_23780 [Streptomyces shaanxiensis]|uniref:Uncharacterized protein n=1 Tax=Streptomyces shaanxiensis TaxID=653357 RepID=A0ABP7UT81_9ACTN